MPPFDNRYKALSEEAKESLKANFPKITGVIQSESIHCEFGGFKFKKGEIRQFFRWEVPSPGTKSVEATGRRRGCSSCLKEDGRKKKSRLIFCRRRMNKQSNNFLALILFPYVRNFEAIRPLFGPNKLITFTSIQFQRIFLNGKKNPFCGKRAKEDFEPANSVLLRQNSIWPNVLLTQKEAKRNKSLERWKSGKYIGGI